MGPAGGPTEPLRSHMNDDQFLLASAYLDDDVDSAARARAEADPEVMAEVARMRSARDAMRDVETPDPARREQALAAAMSTFVDRIPVGQGPRDRVRASRSHRSWWGGIAAAAAALVVIVAGAVVLRNMGGGDDSATSAIESPSDQLSAANESSAGNTSAARPNAAADDTDSGGAPAGEAPSAAATIAPGTTTTNGSFTTVLATPQDLIRFADAMSDGDQPQPTDSPTCTGPGDYLGPATYGGSPVEVFLDGRVATALDATTCAVLAEAER